MSPFKVDDRVVFVEDYFPYAQRGDRGTVTYVEGVNKHAESRRLITVRVDGRGKSALCFARRLKHLEEKPVEKQTVRSGDRIRIVLEGRVETPGLSPTGRTKITIDGARTSNLIDLNVSGATYEVIEPTYKTGDVVKDASGRFWRKHRDGGWNAFGDSCWHSHEVPSRPLTLVGNQSLVGSQS